MSERDRRHGLHPVNIGLGYTSACSQGKSTQEKAMAESVQAGTFG